ncbi:MAG TPA: ATP-binding protein [Candidatus Limnocylindrales bacterium]|nr:ATP-binding protein [Candidatus Limnocylindrales bacterium]
MIKRDLYINKLKPLINDPLIKVITGMRRVGKSTLLLLIQEELKLAGVSDEQFISINFELMDFETLKTPKSLHDYIGSQIVNNKKYFLFLDEIQEVSGFEKIVNSINLKYDVDIYITGSNSKILSGELATYLTGRYFSLELYPLSFLEIVGHQENSSINTDLEQEFIDYIKYGGLPAIQRFGKNEELIKGYLEDIYASILLNDIVARYSIRDVDLLKRFIRYLLHNIGQIFSAQSIANFMKSESRGLSRETLYNYLDACKNAFLIYGVPRYDIKGKQVLKTREKYYTNDLGIRGLFYNNEADIGQALENIAFLQLLRSGYKVNVGEFGNQEVDFIAEKGSAKVYFQVAYLLANTETIEREFTALEKIQDNFPKYVLSMDKLKIERKGIKHLNFIDFLLDQEGFI